MGRAPVNLMTLTESIPRGRRSLGGVEGGAHRLLVRWLLAMAADRAYRPSARQPSFTSKEHPGKHRPARPICEQTLSPPPIDGVPVGVCRGSVDSCLSQTFT